MQRIYDVNRWARVTAGAALPFPGLHERKVRLEVNSPAEVSLWYVDRNPEANGEVYFLALVKGRDEVSFQAHGQYDLMVDGGDCFVYTDDGDNIAIAVDAPESFVKIMERRVRNPELELIAAKMSENMDRRLRQMAGDMERAAERRVAAAIRNQKPAAESVPAGAGSEPEPHGDAGAPADAAPTADAGRKKGK